MIGLAAATAQMKGPHIDWAALSPILAPAVGGLVLLLIGLLGSAVIRERVVPALAIVAFAAMLGCAIWCFDHPAQIVSSALRIDPATQTRPKDGAVPLGLRPPLG